ncbi:MAG: hypothetical protein M3072_12860 [Candidatus Dormibacteraeota bacterium]|nr:hypothetical protein [Candidatus Dormibacteraeota bacterium]
MATLGRLRNPQPRRVGGSGRRGISGLGLLLVVTGLLVAALALSGRAGGVLRFWPALFVLVGGFGLIRRPGWIQELDWRTGGRSQHLLDSSRRLFSLALLLFGVFCLPFTLHLLDARLVGPALLIALGLLLVWRRTR